MKTIDRRLFFGRRRDIYNLSQLIRAEPLVVLLARSGVGKTSLINAGLMQPLREAGYFPVVVRVNSSHDDPLASLYRGVELACDKGVANRHIDSYEPGDPSNWNRLSLWHFVKTLWLWRGSRLLQPVLIIDQIEELFTLVSDNARAIFVEQLADLVRGNRPRSAAARRDHRESDLTDRPPQVRVVLSIREDFLARLEEMVGRIPSILRARYRLRPLQAAEARLAIQEPAKIESPGIVTPRFEWSAEAVGCVVDFLRQRRSSDGEMRLGDEVEPFQLQLICQYVEDLSAVQGLDTILLTHLGGTNASATLQGILERFYERCLTTVHRERYWLMPRRRLERICEHELISEAGRRLLSEEASIVRRHRVPKEVLRRLVELRLIRKEERVGDTYYELTHDALLDPILSSRRRHEFRRWRRWGYLVAALTMGLAVMAGLAWLQELENARLALRDQPEELAQLPVRGQVAVGDSVDEYFGFFERALGGVVLHTFELPPATANTVRVDVSSDEIDPYVLVQTSDGVVLWDDDSGPGLDSSLTVSATARVRIIVTSFGGGEVGRYRLSITEIPSELESPLERQDLLSSAIIGLVPPAGELVVGGSVSDFLQLSDDVFGLRLAAWDLSLDHPESLRITLSAEGDFDPYMVVQTPTGAVLVDDDSGDGRDARLELRDMPPGAMRIIATSYSGLDTGGFVLTVERLD